MIVLSQHIELNVHECFCSISVKVVLLQHSMNENTKDPERYRGAMDFNNNRFELVYNHCFERR